MNQFDHQHIVHLLGVCFHHDQQPQFLVLELMNKGDLQNYLRSSRPNQNHEQCRLSYDACLDIARQIADGACYLEQHGYVHRSVKSQFEKIFIEKNSYLLEIWQHEIVWYLCQIILTIKLLSRSVILVWHVCWAIRIITEKRVKLSYRFVGWHQNRCSMQFLLRIRISGNVQFVLFICRELSHHEFRSFGIVLWEIITLGQVPYSPLNNQQVVSLITTTRGTLEKPNHCTNAL